MTDEQIEEWFQRTYIDTGYIVETLKNQQQNEIDQHMATLQYAGVTNDEATQIQQQINEVKQRQLMRILKYGK